MDTKDVWEEIDLMKTVKKGGEKQGSDNANLPEPSKMNNNKKTEEKTEQDKARELNEKLKAGAATEQTDDPTKGKQEKSEDEKTVAITSETVKPAEIKNGQLILTDKHKQLIKDQIAPTATTEELDLFLMMAYRTRLDPLMKQLYFIKYKDNKASYAAGCLCKQGCTCGKAVYNPATYVTSIDGYRIIAHRTGEFDGVDEPEYKYTEKPVYKSVEKKLYSCTVRVYKKGSSHPFAATVKFDEYNTGRNLWAKMPETMIAKVAEAHALRKAFPQDLSGIYTTDEMDQARQQAKEGEIVNKKPPVLMINKSQAATIKLLMDGKEISIEDMKRIVAASFRKDSLAQLMRDEADRLIKVLEDMPTPGVDDGEVIEDEQFNPDAIDEGIEAERQKNAAESAA